MLPIKGHARASFRQSCRRPCCSQPQKERRMGPNRQRDRHSALAVWALDDKT